MKFLLTIIFSIIYFEYIKTQNILGNQSNIINLFKQTSVFKTLSYEVMCKISKNNKFSQKSKYNPIDKFPKSKFNPYEKEYGRGKVAYLFDFLDDVLKKNITTQFKYIWKNVTSIRNHSDLHYYKDPYDKDNLMKAAREIYGVKLEDINYSDVDRIRKVMPNFDPVVHYKSITFPMFIYSINKYKWNNFGKSEKYIKTLFDSYDFDGDGRLNIREFILFSIINNVKNADYMNCKNCYKDIIIDILDPIFKIIDCSEEELVETEEICNGLKHLVRSDDDRYNMYKCEIDGKFYHSTSCNELILKNNKKVKGMLDIREFREGILLGYWDRHTNETKIDMEDGFSGKLNRWPNPTTDIYCEKIEELSNFNKNKK